MQETDNCYARYSSALHDLAELKDEEHVPTDGLITTGAATDLWSCNRRVLRFKPCFYPGSYRHTNYKSTITTKLIVR